MTTERLQEFVLLASILNYSNAAQILYITQSTLSRHIAEMEEELGFQLFNRTTRNVELTEAGRLFSLSVSKLLEKYGNAVSRLHIQGVTATGTLSIVYTTSSSFPPFLEFCKKFRAKYPGIDLKMELTEGPGLQNLDNHDLYFTPGSYPDFPKEIKKARVFPQAAYLFLPPEHPLLHRSSIDYSLLKGSTVYLANDDSSYNGPYTYNYQRLLRMTDNNLRVEYLTSPVATLVNVNMGKGISILPASRMVEEYNSTPSIVMRDPDCNFDINVFYNSNNLTPTAALFLSELLPLQLPEVVAFTR